jgi:hypothetical protein|tara:strand:+ start:133 stop:291 length:159 start_codon:yes stop_codon:yes gene_type:complete
MKQPDFHKMRLMLCKNEAPDTQEYIMDKMDKDEIMYEFIKAFGHFQIPKKEV